MRCAGGGRLLRLLRRGGARTCSYRSVDEAVGYSVDASRVTVRETGKAGRATFLRAPAAAGQSVLVERPFAWHVLSDAKSATDVCQVSLLPCSGHRCPDAAGAVDCRRLFRSADVAAAACRAKTHCATCCMDLRALRRLCDVDAAWQPLMVADMMATSLATGEFDAYWGRVAHLRSRLHLFLGKEVQEATPSAEARAQREQAELAARQHEYGLLRDAVVGWLGAEDAEQVLGAAFTFASYHQVHGMLSLNALRLRVARQGATDADAGDGAAHVSALLPQAALINHSCDPSAEVQFPDPAGAAHVVARRDLRAGDEVTIDYVGSIPRHHRRRFSLASLYGIVCDCDTCPGARPEAPGGGDGAP